MTYKKPQSPIMNGADGIYPLTTADQVIKSDGSRLEQNGKIVADNSTTANNANMLANKAPESYVLHNDVLSLEEIEASTNLTGKVASAESAKNINTVVSTIGAISLGYINSGSYVKFRANGIFFILFGPNTTTTCMDSYGDDGIRYVRSLTTSTDEYYTLTKETDGSFTLVNNVPWAVSYILFGVNCAHILE